MKKIYFAPTLEITCFKGSDEVSTRIERSAVYRHTYPEGVGANSYTNVFDF